MEEEARAATNEVPAAAPMDAPSPQQKPTSPRASSTGERRRLRQALGAKRAAPRRSTIEGRNTSSRRRRRRP